MLTETLLGAILASQWVIASKAGVKMDEFTKAMGQAFNLPGLVSSEILPFSRKVIDLTDARTREDQNISGLWCIVESCTGTNIQAYLNKNSAPLPDPLLLDQIDKFYWPFQKLYLTNAAQPGKQITLLFGRASGEVWRTYTADINAAVAALVAAGLINTAALIAAIAAIPLPTIPTYHQVRWGIDREPAWVDGALLVAPAAGAALVTQTVTVAMLGRVFGIHISADEANQFDLCLAGTPLNHYVMAAGGTLDIVLASPIQDAIVAGTAITIEPVVKGTGANVYQASLLYDEA